MPVDSKLRLVVVTPETTLLDEAIDAVRFPLYDGQMGVLPGSAPAAGKLGYGEMTVTVGGQDRRDFIDGGFVQIKGPVVSILTDRALPVNEIDPRAAQQQLEAALARPAKNEAEIAARLRDQQRARSLLAVARPGA